ncbi:small subunit ribosomal protein S6e [Nematocida homosporus]|uniref:small subunit ribosomal protein S6e n=1 Tax=Nematocida homosporus TaxID=1912981 RepID=UPI00222110F7|nr:small subunit ribosomal protein S6e [Nematocida homosporus]KAI5185253.1 small subunit ribosomal protein S6e [Nematocida homosporus]
MKLSIANPARTTQTVVEVENHVEAVLYEKQIGDIIEAEFIGPEWKGFLLKITGGADKQGFPMKPGVQKQERVRLLLKKGDVGFRCNRDGLRRRKTVRGCIVSKEIRVLNLAVLKEGEHVFEGFNDRVTPLPKGPKRATKIRKLFNLSNDVTDLEPYVIGHEKTLKNGETVIVKPKIQRLVTEKKKERWARRITERIARQTKSRQKKIAYFAMLKERGITVSK